MIYCFFCLFSENQILFVVLLIEKTYYKWHEQNLQKNYIILLKRAGVDLNAEPV